MDSLRRDFLGCYGDEGAMTPHLDRFAKEATRFTQAYAVAPWSKPSGAALLTGHIPRALRMRALLDRLPDSVPTLTEQLGNSGFRTIAVSANPFISHDFGMLRGFTETLEAFRPGVLPSETFHFHANHFRRLADGLSVAPEALVLGRSPALHRALLERLPPTGPTFALCWSMDTHAPFFVRGEQSFFGNPLDRVIPAADSEWLSGSLTVRDMVSLYRDMIAYNDLHFGALIEQLRERGQWEEALIIVTGDHGEAFGEHRLMGHTNGLWEEQVAVPLLVKFPGQRTSARREVPVSLTDIVPTILEAAGIERMPNISGVALQSLVAGAEQERALLLENPEGWALRFGDWKAIAPTDGGLPLLFNLRTDPEERHPLPDDTLRRELTLRAATLRDTADRQASQWVEPEEDEVDDVVLQRLRNLGYL
ncbi:MAG: sulfatase-like hydrolase/transferase [Chloroflexota bacterium]|nr:sulfatase-like hydrolase/transferase [Chloroflexota bacterium]